MKNNPFLANTFKTIWLKYFRPKNSIHSFKSIKHIQFYKNKSFPLYINIGKNITNGMYYELDETEKDFRSKTFLIHDVPQYFNINTNYSGKLKVKKARQYKGFAVDLNEFSSFDDYFKFKYKSKTRSNYLKSERRLKASFNTSFISYHGKISKEEYNKVFNSLIQIIERRFDSLGLDNSIISRKEYYRELAYNMILKKEAVLSVMYSEGEPISISLGFLSEDILFFAITTFDIDYSRYNIGHTSIMELMTWCFENKIKILDFSKGEYEYKVRWSNLEYNFECHVIYDPKSIISSILGLSIYSYFVFKQGLRDIRVNYLFSNLKFNLKRLTKPRIKKIEYRIEEIPLSEGENLELEKIDLYSPEHRFLKKPLYNYLYSNPHKIASLSFYKSIDQLNKFHAIGENIHLVILNSEMN